MTAIKRTAKAKRIDVADLKAAAAGRELDILQHVAGIPAELLDRQHHPCPKCGGTDRFRLVDASAGAAMCNQCFSTGNGDFIAVVRWMTGCDFPEALRRIAEYLGMPSDPATGPGQGKPSVSLADQFVIIEDKLQSVFTEMFSVKKPPIEPASVSAAGGIAVRWPAKSKSGDPCIAWPATDDQGNVVGWILRKTTGHVFAAIGKLQARKTHMIRGSKDGWVIPGGLDRLQAAEVVWKVEGVPDALALHPLLPADHVAVTNICGAKAIPPFQEPFRGKVIFVVGDADRPGEDGAAKYAAKLSPIAAEVRVVRLPFEVTEDSGKDLRDYFLEGGTFAGLQTLADAAPVWIPATVENREESRSHQDSKATIEVDNDESRVLEEILIQLPKVESIYQRNCRLVRVEYDGGSDGNAPRIADLPESVLRNQITKFVSFKRWKGSEEDAALVSAPPPAPVIKAVHQLSQWQGVPRLAGVLSAPTIRPDGTILSQPGYDAMTALLLTDTVTLPPITENLTQRGAVRAAQRLLEVVRDFPFKSDSHKSAWLAALLTVLARHAFRGPAPMFLIDANTRGSGKSLLADIISLIALGVCASRFSNPSDDDEFRKRITSLVRSGEILVLIDNIASSIGCPSLDAVLTSETWKDRILGQSETIEMIVRLVFIATGNNVSLHGDTSRRTAHIRLESPEERPEEREGFAHSDLRAHVRANRPQLLADALMILSAFFAAGKPSQGLKPWGSFEAWSDIIRNAIVWCGLPDPALTREELVQTSDPQTSALAELLEGWQDIDPGNDGLTAAQILRLVERNPDRFELVRSALFELCSTPAGKLPNVRQVGNRLKSLRGRVVDGRKLDGYINRNKVQTWSVCEAGSSSNSPTEFGAGSAGSAGSVFSPYARDFSLSMNDDTGIPIANGRKPDPADPADPAPLIPDLSEVAAPTPNGRISPQSATAQNLEHSAPAAAATLTSDRGPSRTKSGNGPPTLVRPDAPALPPWSSRSPASASQAGG